MSDPLSPEEIRRLRGVAWKELDASGATRPPAPGLDDPLFGNLAVQRGYLSPEALRKALEDFEQRKSTGEVVRFGQHLLERRLLSLEQFQDVLKLCEQFVLRCPGCGKVYNIAGHRDQVGLLCLQCGKELAVPTEASEVTGPPSRYTPYRLQPLKPGEIYLGRYRLVRQIARGGMGVVYEAEDPDLKRRVALKLLREGEIKPEMVRRLHREAALAARLRHPNIITIYEVGAVRDPSGMLVHYICMDYIDGETLGSAVRTRDLPLDRILEIFEQVARAVHAAHEQDVIHRDLKPENILLDTVGRPVVSDFGLAKTGAEDFSRLTRSGAVMGTPVYMPPEQAEGRLKEIDRQTDIYALGATLYEAVTRKPPFEAVGQLELLRKIMEEEPVRPRQIRPDLPADLETVIGKAMAKEKIARYRTAEALAEDLRRVRTGEPILARPSGTMTRVFHWGRRHRLRGKLLMAAAGIVVVSSILLPILFSERSKREARERELARQKAVQSRREQSMLELGALRTRVALAKKGWYQPQTDPRKTRERIEEILPELETYLRKFPGDPAGLYVRARTLADLERLPEAEKDLRRAVAADEGFSAAWMLLGQVLLQQMEIRFGGWDGMKYSIRHPERDQYVEEIGRVLERGRRTSPTTARDWGLSEVEDDLVLVALARGLHENYVEKNPARALEILYEAYQAHPSEEYAYWIAFIGDGRDHKMKWINDALLRMPHFARAYRARGVTWKVEKQPEKALSDLGRALQIHPDFLMALIDRSAVYSDLGRWSEAERDASRALSIDPELSFAYVNRAVARLRQKDPDGAEADLKQALKLRPEDPAIYQNLGVVYHERGECRESIRTVNRAIELSPDDPNLYMNRAMCLTQLGERDDAIRDYTRTLALQPTRIRAVVARGYLYCIVSDLESAAADAEEALRQDPKCGAAYALRAMLVLKRSELGETVSEEDLDTAEEDLDQAGRNPVSYSMPAPEILVKWRDRIRLLRDRLPASKE